MEYVLESGPVLKDRLTIGLLDETLDNEFKSELMAGVFKAAIKHDVNVIRFGYYGYHSAYQSAKQTSMVLDHLEQYPLDGLMFLGWAKAGAFENYESFTRRFRSTPLFSVGTAFKDIPSAFFSGNDYLIELLRHLIDIHHFRKIAFIAPFRPDNRSEAFESFMKEQGLFDPMLYISEKELSEELWEERGRRIVEILLDKRKCRPDAIVSLTNDETAGIIKALKLRGLSVPEDIAVTSYEDGEMGKHFSPGFTTIYYPWMELGYTACEKMVELLRRGSVPVVNPVKGKIIYRNSCGCMTSSIQIAGGNTLFPPQKKKLPGLSENDRLHLVESINQWFPNVKVDFSALMAAFLEDYSNRTTLEFLTELLVQLRKTSYGYDDTNLEDIISVFRKHLLPFLMDRQEDILWSGDLFIQAQTLIRDKMFNSHSHDKVHNKILHQALQEISQLLISSYSVQNLTASLEASLPKLNIPGCQIVLFNSIFNMEETTETGTDLFDNCILAFNYKDGQKFNIKSGKPATAKQLLSKILASKSKQRIRMAHLLHVTNEFMGFVLYEPGIWDERVYRELTTHISTAIRSSILIEKLDYSYKKLAEQAHREGMADIASGILHNMGNVLNSVSASAHYMRDALNAPVFVDLKHAMSLLNAHMKDLEAFILRDPKGKKLMQFFIKLGFSLGELQNQLLFHAQRLDEKVNSISDIIIAQQSYAGVKTSLEELDLVNVLEDAIKLHSASLEKHSIQIRRAYRSRPKILIQRTKIIHILINLINNAQEAMMETPILQRFIRLSVWSDESGKFLRIEDNGCGIPEEIRDSLLNSGYPSKLDRFGMGLQSSAAFLAESGGEIRAESSGPGKGTAMILHFR